MSTVSCTAFLVSLKEFLCAFVWVISHQIEQQHHLFIDSTHCSIESAPQPPPRRNQREPVRENPFDRPVRPSGGGAAVTSSSHRPAPPPPKHATAPKTNTQGKEKNRNSFEAISFERLVLIIALIYSSLGFNECVFTFLLNYPCLFIFFLSFYFTLLQTVWLVCSCVCVPSNI